MVGRDCAVSRAPGEPASTRAAAGDPAGPPRSDRAIEPIPGRSVGRTGDRRGNGTGDAAAGVVGTLSASPADKSKSIAYEWRREGTHPGALARGRDNGTLRAARAGRPANAAEAPCAAIAQVEYDDRIEARRRPAVRAARLARGRCRREVERRHGSPCSPAVCPPRRWAPAVGPAAVDRRRGGGLVGHWDDRTRGGRTRPAGSLRQASSAWRPWPGSSPRRRKSWWS